jgi:hypothetical protein
MTRKLLVLAVAALLLLSGPAAWADFYVIGGGGSVGTRITYLPYTITAPGHYYLGSNLTCSAGVARAITVNAECVTIDLMGFSLFATNTGIGYGDGIYINGHPNVEIRNGTIANFEGAAITVNNLSTSANHRVIHLNVSVCGQGIILGGGCHHVMGCTVRYNGTGINANGSIIKGNVAQGNGTGILAEDSLLVHNLAAGNSTHNVSATNCTLVDNRIAADP